MKYIIPKDFIRTRGRFTEQPLDINLLRFSRDSINYKLRLVTITQAQRESLTEFSIPTHSSQMAVEIETDCSEPVEMNKSFFEVKRAIILGLILANRGADTVFYDYGGFSDYKSGGQGDILPYAFVQYDNGRINTYYEADYETLTRNLGFYSRFNPRKIELFKKILDELLLNQNSELDEAVAKLAIRSHTLSSVKGAQMYMNTITIFSCFESLLGTGKRNELCNSVECLDRLRFVRHAIAHSDDFDLFRKGKKCIAVKHYDRYGNKLNPPKKKELSIDNLERARIILVDKITQELEIDS